MKSLQEYIKEVDEEFNPEWDYVIEMASIGYPILDKEERLIAVHGINSGERIRPHIHIYLGYDRRPFNKFNFEIALDELLCYDELNLIRMKDQSKHIDKKNRNICSWKNYTKLKHDFDDWLFSKCSLRGDFKDNLDAIIYWYNEESMTSHEQNPLLKYIQDHGSKILDKYKKYFSTEDQETYKDCF